ncbi:MAG: hypothetical protein ACOYL8_01755 [Patescibacteria group bacterium]
MKFESQIFKKQSSKDESEKKRMTDKEREAEWEKNNQKKIVFAFDKIFKENSDPKERLAKFNEGLGKVLVMLDEDEIGQEIINEIKEEMERICLLNNKTEFIERGINSLKPIIDWQRENRGLFEIKEREAFINNNNYIPLNEMLAYGRDKDSIHIHVAPSTTLDIGTKFSLLKNGFRNLQEVLRNDESILEVTATSWIVATESGRGILEKFGFTIKDEKSIKDMASSRLNDHEGRPIGIAHISRKDFLSQKI